MFRHGEQVCAVLSCWYWFRSYPMRKYPPSCSQWNPLLRHHNSDTRFLLPCHLLTYLCKEGPPRFGSKSGMLAIVHKIPHGRIWWACQSDKFRAFDVVIYIFWWPWYWYNIYKYIFNISGVKRRDCGSRGIVRNPPPPLRIAWNLQGAMYHSR